MVRHAPLSVRFHLAAHATWRRSIAKRRSTNAEIATLEAALRLQQEQRPAPDRRRFLGRRAVACSSCTTQRNSQRRLADALFRGSRRRQAFEQLESAVHDYQSAREQLRLGRPTKPITSEITDALLLERLVELANACWDPSGLATCRCTTAFAGTKSC